MNEVFPLLLLDRDEVTASGESAIAPWLGGFCPITFSFDVEQLEGDESDSFTVWAGFEGRGDIDSHGWTPGDDAWFRATGSSSGVDKTDGRVAGSPRGRIHWTVGGGSWRLRVWLESSPWRGGVGGVPLGRGNVLTELL